MSGEPNRSEQVLEQYKQRKLARSALLRIQDLIRQFEAEDAFDRKAARVGILALAVLLGAAVFFMYGGAQITLG